MHRYLLFAFNHYYPAGGVNDLVGSADTVEELKQLTITDNDIREYDVHEIVDSTTMKVVIKRVCYWDEAEWKEPVK